MATKAESDILKLLGFEKPEDHDVIIAGFKKLYNSADLTTTLKNFVWDGYAGSELRKAGEDAEKKRKEDIDSKKPTTILEV